MLEEGPPRGLMHRREMLMVIGESRRQSLGAAIGKLWGGAVDHDQERVHLLRKCRIEL